MKRHVFAIACVGLGLTSVALTRASGPTTAPSTQPVNKFCAVEHDDPVDPAVTYVYEGKTIGFCCKDCVPKFKANPEKYVKDMK
jgi:YHS domain-containing protein